MKNKKILGIVIGIIIVLLIGLSILFLKNKEDENATYKIVVSVIEKNSPDRNVVVLKNNKKVDFDSIYYLDDVLLCKGKNPTINKNDVQNSEELKIKLKNKKIVKAIVKKEEK